uniref:acrosomal protein SP-10 isoform X3 n=1 Tax=Callithrix jacchus TaxID=9483 RepID=UPI0023DD296D|nr:acrosomal protein SP-10 isoform X3 [Callithrix jacchus]
MNVLLLLMSLYLLGFARALPSLFCSFSTPGTSGQPDEPSGFIDHQASVRQLSGEPAAAEHAAGEQPSGEKSSGEHISGEQPSGEHASSEQPSGEHALGEQPSSEQPSGEHASGEQTSGEHTVGEQPSGEHESGEQTSGEQTSGEHAAGEQPSGEQSLGEHALSEKPSGEEPSGATISSTSIGILNCYACAYMNDQGKCLRGEGICTTQNSQQCMLKKIFEGEKLQFMVQGCENMCPSMNLFSHGTRMQITCCRNQSFCNKI